MKELILLFILSFLSSTMPMVAEEDSQQYNLTESLAVLELLGAQIDKDTQMTTLSPQADEKIIYFNEQSFATLNEENKIIEIDRIRETSEPEFKKHIKKTDYKKTKALIEEKLIKNNYELVNSGYFDETTISLRYEKILPHGGHDQYDAYDVYIDTDNGALVSLKKKGAPRTPTSKDLNHAKTLISKKNSKIARLSCCFLCC